MPSVCQGLLGCQHAEQKSRYVPTCRLHGWLICTSVAILAQAFRVLADHGSLLDPVKGRWVHADHVCSVTEAYAHPGSILSLNFNIYM